MPVSFLKVVLHGLQVHWHCPLFTEAVYHIAAFLFLLQITGWQGGHC